MKKHNNKNTHTMTNRSSRNEADKNNSFIQVRRLREEVKNCEYLER